MLTTGEKFTTCLRENWFFPAAIAVVSTDLFIGRLDNWSNARVLETGILLDLAVVIPALYFWCYRSRGKPAVLRTIALCCLGLWAAGFIVPVEHQFLLTKIEFVRYIGLAVVLVAEIKLMRLVYSAGFSRDKGAKSSVLETVKEEGMPEWVARILVWEASVWRKVADFIRTVIGKR